MADATLRMGPAQGATGLPNRLVWVGDSISGQNATEGSDEDQESTDAFLRWGDRLAVELAHYGVDRYTGGWSTVTGSDAPSYGSSPADWVFHDLQVGGTTTNTWPASGKAATVPSFATPVTILVVQFGRNNFGGANSTTVEQFEAGLVARLNEWTQVQYKFVLMGWLQTTDATTLQAWHDAGAAAAAAASPGDRQGAVQYFNVGGSTCATEPGVIGSPTPDEYSYDGVHLSTAGAQHFHDTLWPLIEATL